MNHNSITILVNEFDLIRFSYRGIDHGFSIFTIDIGAQPAFREGGVGGVKSNVRQEEEG